MAIQFSETVRNARANQIESTINTAPKLYIRTGAQPANCAAADSGTLLATLSLPSDWLNDAATGAKTLLGSWSGSATDSGTAEHFRIKDTAGTTCHMQGSIGQGSGDLSLDDNTITSGQTINITTFTLTEANA